MNDVERAEDKENKTSKLQMFHYSDPSMSKTSSSVIASKNESKREISQLQIRRYDRIPCLT